MEHVMRFIFFFQQAGPGQQSGEFDATIVWQTLVNLAQSLLARLPYLILGFGAFCVCWFIGSIAKRVIHTAGERTRLDVMLMDLFGRLASAAMLIIGLFVAAVIIFPTFKPGDLIAGLGITTVAIGFAFKDILQNFFAGVLILWRRPFVIGDQIRTLDYEGTVEDINIRSTRLKTYDGERVVLPNGDVYTHPILVRTAYDKRRVRFTVGIGYPDSIEDARSTIHRVLRETEGVLPNPGPWVYVAELAPHSVNFDVYFWVTAEQANVLKVTDAVATRIKLTLNDAGIDLPYPHQVVIFHDAAGTRSGDIEQAAYLGQRDGTATRSGPVRR
jgi:small conductance mechanosensitive channel